MTMNHRVWILGAPDPEMELIESVLRECGERVEHATVWRDGVRRRVTPAEAYGPDVEIGAGLRGLRATAYMVECATAVLVGSSIDGIDWAGGVVKIDHHRPGDPGYGRPPSEFFAASSIGQVIATLARLMLPLGWETIPGPSWPWESGTYEMTTVRDRRVWRSDPGVYDTSGEWDWAVSCGAGCWYIIPREFVLAAAADHCLPAAYRGECPGVDPDELMRWRVSTRAAFQRRSVEELLVDVERAREALREAPLVSLGFDIDAPGCAHHRGCAVPDCGDCDYEGGALIVRDLRGCAVCGGYGGATGAGEDHGYDPSVPCHYGPAGVPELPEAAAREGVAYLATVTERDGRRKVVLGGHTTPEMVRAFMREWAPAQGLTDIYGDPARGFAGGYLPSHRP